MGICVCFFLFVCFKQNTAYEMRISDWSSDVCSSDLQTRQVHAQTFMDAATQRHVRRLAIKSHLLRVGIEGRVAADDRCGYRQIIARNAFLPAEIDFLRGDPERRYRTQGTQETLPPQTDRRRYLAKTTPV